VKRSGIYLLTHRESGRRYVGQSLDIDARWKAHSRGETGSGYVSNAIEKHGWAAFHATVLELCGVDVLNEAEVRWIAALGTTTPHGYNLTTGGRQYRFTDEARAVISAATKRAMTPEHCAKLSAAKKGIPKSPEWRAMMSERQKNPDNLARMAAHARNRTADERAKISAGNTGKVRTQEVKDRISATKRAQQLKFPGRVLSAEVRTKMAASAKTRWARQAEGKRAGEVTNP
jgi:group I intron endonuclease